MSMLAQLWGVLPLVVFGCLVIVMRADGRSWVESLLGAVPWWAAGVWGVSNVLSACDALRPGVLQLVWVVAAMAAFGYTVRRCLGAGLKWRGEGAMPVTWFERVLAAGTVFLVLVAGVTAVMAPPSTVDVLSYHGPRQLLWLQQGSLAHFMTVNDRQLMMPPLAEVIGLQFLAVTGGDFWMNLPQWFAYAVLPVVVGSTLTALGASRRQAWVGAWLMVCLPMAYAEASNAKNDLIGALWITLLLREVALARKGGGEWEAGTAVRTGLVLGLAVLTKSTAFLFAPPLIVAGALAWRRVRTPAVWKTSGTAALVALLVAAPFYLRNVGWYGSPLGEHRAEDGGHQENEALSPTIFVSNMMRGATQHLAGPSGMWNGWLERGVRTAHGWMGISVDDARSTCWTETFEVVYAPYDETQAAAPWHFIVIVIAAGAAMVVGRRGAELHWLAWVCVAMTVMYCLVLKWQPWAPRLQQPVFVTGIVLAVLAAGRIAERGRGLILGGLVAGGLVAWWPGREVAARPLLREPSVLTTDREALTYRYLPLLRERDDSMVRILKEAGARSVLIVSVHDIPFPLMQKLRREIPAVHFHGAPVEDAERNPDAIMQLGLLSFMGLYHTMSDGSRYRLVGDYVGDGLYLPEAVVEAKGWRHRLPAFAGWTRHTGLAFHEDEWRPDGAAVWRELVGTEASIDFPSQGMEVRLIATVITGARETEMLRFLTDGREAGVVELNGVPGVQHFEFRLACRPGMNRLTFRRSGGGAPLKFVRLQVNDIP